MNADAPRADSLVRFAEAIAPSGLNAREIAEALWLAAHVQGLGTGAAAGTEARDDPPPAGAEAVRAAAERQAPARTRRRLPVRSARDGSAHRPGHPRNPQEGPAGVPVRIPAPSGSDAQMIGRALRRLRERPTPGPLWGPLDEAATADRAALSGICWPVPERLRPRRATAALLVDSSVSMELWRDLAADLEAGLALSGAFRTVHAWSFYQRDGRARITSRHRAHAAEQAVELLHDPSSRSVVLILTDGVSALWHSGVGAAAAAALSAHCPVAVIEPLPHRLWRRTGLRVQSAPLVSVPLGSAGCLLAIRGDGAARAVAVPVLQPELPWFAGWSNLVSGRSTSARQAVVGLRPAAPTGRAGSERPTRPGEPAVAVASGRQVLRRFESMASATACDLAAALSLVPLSLPVMRAVLTLCFPSGSTVHLAEVVTGGLMHRAGGRRSPGSAPAFQWLPGVREELRRRLTASRELEVLDALSHYLDQDLGMGIGSREYQAVMPLPELRSGGRTIGAGELIAHVSPETARRLLKRIPASDSVLTGHPHMTNDELSEQLGERVERAEVSGREIEIETAIESARHVMAALPDRNSRHWTGVRDLARMLVLRWRTSSELDDLDEAVFVLRSHLESAEPGLPGTGECLGILADVLLTRFGATSAPDNLDDSISVRRSAITALLPFGTNVAEQRVLLAETLLTQYGLTGTALPLYEAVDLLADLEPVERLEPQLRISVRFTLARCLDAMSRTTRTEDDIAAADRQLLTLLPDLALVAAASAVAIRQAFTSRVDFLMRTGRKPSADILNTALERELEHLPSNWGRVNDNRTSHN
ncbi:SAV_2336 N-terminal domain-related protein [Streptomyces sp. H39-S7]|uniref:SAV_2336 N-terminal domain-related protein n=1 Tax=Streptomyces sp. H39-S7 TaxID=3004357 RepID=UPI0022AEC36C|nr:SAV_2336 N-terminal domain-related protein [Streptomyces sp. H39-S7]MCZ4121077.1 SAV_2336 N-terminal domain-related protein [Streptomyces sp. H39-S7]